MVDLLARPTRGKNARSAVRRGFRVDRLDEIEAVGRGIEAKRGTITRLQRLGHIVRLPLSAADQRQAPDHRAHLVAEEAARCGGDMDFFADLPEIEPVERLYGTIRLA